MTLYGPDSLGGSHFQKALIMAQRPGDCAGVFLRTFGPANKTVREMAASGKFAEITVHLAPFDKTHKYDLKTYYLQVKRDARWLESLAVQFPKTKFLLSPFCEHRHGPKVMGPIFKELKQIAPHCLMLNSVWGVASVPGVITEIHLENSKQLPKKPSGEYTVSFDGFGGDGSGDMPDCDVHRILTRYSDARQIRYWNFRLNGKFGHLDTTPVDKRDCWPSVEYLRGHRALMDPRQGGLTWASGLYKPFADDHGGDHRTKDNKAMCILPGIAKDSVRVFDIHGNVIDKMVRMVPDHTGKPKGPRYYSSLYAYQIGDIAEKGTGSRLIRVENSPFTDADLRSGMFR